jgi:hypothetical protein
MTLNRRVNGNENENEKRQRAAALHNLAEARRASNRAKRLGVRCPRTAFGCVRLRKEHSIVAKRSHPPQSGRGLPHSKTGRKHDAPRTARSVLECVPPHRFPLKTPA